MTNCDGRILPLCLALLLTCTAFNANADAEKPTQPAERRPGVLAGYLPPRALPNSLALLPPQPTPGSAAQALDEENAKQNLALRGTPRWTLAIADANLRFPQAADTFSCAVGAPISEAETPHLYTLLRRSLSDAGLSTYAAKNHYKRARPFMTNNEPICTPDDKAGLEKDGSYPSGHTAIGWAWALILSEISPEQANAILARGKAFGESRSVCNLHWHSDIVQGRFMGASTVARLHAEPAFRDDLELAKSELAAVRAKNLKPTRDCNEEATAMAPSPAK